MLTSYNGCNKELNDASLVGMFAFMDRKLDLPCYFVSTIHEFSQYNINRVYIA